MECVIHGYHVFIDDEDFESVKDYHWHIRKSSNECIYFYRIFYDPEVYKNEKICGIPIYLHRQIMGCTRKDGKTVDHIDGNTFNCRKSNLRFCTKSQNQYNSKMQKNNHTGLKGVIKVSKNRYSAHIGVDKKYISLGLYETPELAHVAYCEASKKYHGEFGRTK